jgi:hypothetical protein
VLPLVVFTDALPGTLLADACPGLLPPDVLLREKMPMDAVGFVCVGSAHVFEMGHGFQVVWTHATTILAEMVNLQAIFDRAIDQLIREPMGYDVGFSQPEQPVAVSIGMTFVDPALVSLPDLGPESQRWIYVVEPEWNISPNITSLEPAHVMRQAPALGSHWTVARLHGALNLCHEGMITRVKCTN